MSRTMSSVLGIQFKYFSSFVIFSAFLNIVPINRSLRPEQITEEDFDGPKANSLLSERIVSISPFMSGIGLGAMIIGGIGLLDQNVVTGDIIKNFGCCISSVVLTNKEFYRMTSNIEKAKNRSNRNREKLKNERKKVQRREAMAQEVQMELSNKDRQLALINEEYLRTKGALEKELFELKKKNEFLMAQKDEITLQRDEITSQKDLANAKIDLTRELLTANCNSKSNRFNIYSILFSAKIVCTFILTFGTFRGLSRTLRSLREVELFKVSSLPCANSIINWSMRAGLGKLQAVEKVDEEFIIIVDHWIGKGTQKIFAALRLLKSDYDKLTKEKRAISLKNLELVKIKVMESANAQTNYQCLKEIFEKIGDPLAVLCDEGSDLVSAITLYNTLEGKQIERIIDISHFAANALKKKYSNEIWFQEFMNESSAGSSKIRQTKFAQFQSPTLRIKARFMNLSSHARWAIRIIDIVKGPRKADEEVKQKLQEVFGITITHNEHIREFALTLRVVNLVSRILKTRGLNEKSLKLTKNILQKLPESDEVRNRLNTWLDNHSKLLNKLKQKGWGKSLPTSSDSIESFFFQAQTATE